MCIKASRRHSAPKCRQRQPTPANARLQLQEMQICRTLAKYQDTNKKNEKSMRRDDVVARSQKSFECSETEQARPPFSKWVDDERSQEKANGNTNGDLDD